MTYAKQRGQRVKGADGFLAVLGFFAIAGAAVVLFPGIDLSVSGLFYNPEKHFFLKDLLFCTLVYRFVEVFSGFLALVLPILFLITLVRRKPIFRFDRKKIVYLILVLAIGPGLMVNVLLKDHWGRARPNQVQEFGGQKRFTSAWVMSNECMQNCAFVSGHASMGFYLFAFAFLSHHHRKKWMGLALICGFVIGLVRIMQGSHFVSDVIFAGMMVYLVAWILSLIIAGGDKDASGKVSLHDPA